MLTLLATTREKDIDGFLRSLKGAGEVDIEVVQTGAEVLEKVRSKAPSFVIVDEGLPDFEPLPLVTEIMKINAMVNTAVVSSLSAKEFHDASEGLGVLSSIPPEPTEEDGLKVRKVFEKFM